MGRYTGSPDTLVFDQRIDLSSSFCRPEHPSYPSPVGTARLINCVCGSLVNINWISPDPVHMFPLRAQLIKSTLEPGCIIITLIG